MMKNEEKFFKGIEDTLHGYEDAYVPGAWEAFDQKRKRKSMAVLFLKWGSAAAALLLVGYAAFVFLAKSPENVEIAGNKKPVEQPKTNQATPVKPQQVEPLATGNVPGSIQQPQVAAIDTPAPGQQPNPVANKVLNKPVNANNNIAIAKQRSGKFENEVFDYFPPDKRDSTVIAKNNVDKALNDVQNTVTQNNPVVKQQTDNAPDKVIANNNKRPASSGRSVYDSLVNSKNSVALASTKPTVEKVKEKRINYGVELQPSVGNQKVNFGSGVQVSYKLTDKFSVSSGLAYSSMRAATSAGGANASGLGSSQSVNLEVSGLQVPIGVQYHTDNGFYVSAGVTGMSVMNNHLEYNYTAESAVTRTAFDASGASYNAISVVAENKTEESKEKVANYIGFYNLSIGKKKTIGKKNNISFGPFVNIPFGPISSEKIRLLQGGVKLGFGFQ